MIQTDSMTIGGGRNWGSVNFTLNLMFLDIHDDLDLS
jgi:hypothetical protein